MAKHQRWCRQSNPCRTDESRSECITGRVSTGSPLVAISPWVAAATSNTLVPKALVDGFAEPTPEDECDYCGYARSEGAVLVPVGTFDGNSFATVLCRSCSTDPVLGACGHRRTCDCTAA